MESHRLILFASLFLVLFLLWDGWQGAYGPQRAVQIAEMPLQVEGEVKKADIPDAPEEMASVAKGSDTPLEVKEVFQKAQQLHVVTDVLDIEIDTRGGDIRKAKLLKHPVSSKTPEDPFALMNDSLPNIFIAQTGIISSQDAPDHHDLFSAKQTEYRMRDNKDELKVQLYWQGKGGVSIVKTYTFKRDSYLINIDYQVKSPAKWEGRLYSQFQRVAGEDDSSRFIYTYTGGVISSKDKPYTKVSFDDMEDANLKQTIEGGWAAMIQHYFLGAWIPQQDVNNYYYTKVLDGPRYVIGTVSPGASANKNQTAQLSTQLYVGPKVQKTLEEIAPHLELTVDFGWLTILAKPIFWLLVFIEGLVQNWGWSIILLTMLIKLAFYKLSETSYRSMANMKKLQPRLTALKERFGDDKTKLHKAMMDMYKKEKINPLGGCLPILVQIPVFIALYWVLLESVELRQASFIFWLTDLSTKDPYFVLPVIMGVSMLIQQKLNPAPMDPIQQKVMMALPFIFTVFFAFFPSGLVLYWVVNNILSITQQWVINKRITGSA